METEENDAHVFNTKEYAATNRDPYISYSYSELQNGTVSPLLTKDTVKIHFYQVVILGQLYMIRQLVFYHPVISDGDIHRATSSDD